MWHTCAIYRARTKQQRRQSPSIVYDRNIPCTLHTLAAERDMPHSRANMDKNIEYVVNWCSVTLTRDNSASSTPSSSSRFTAIAHQRAFCVCLRCLLGLGHILLRSVETVTYCFSNSTHTLLLLAPCPGWLSQFSTGSLGRDAMKPLSGVAALSLQSTTRSSFAW